MCYGHWALGSELVVFSGKKVFGIIVGPYLSKFQRNMSGRSTFYVCLRNIAYYPFNTAPS